VLGEVLVEVQDAPENAHVVACGHCGPETGSQAVPSEGSRHRACLPDPVDEQVEDEDNCGHHLRGYRASKVVKLLIALTQDFGKDLMLCSRLK
jgi:hypothetical protein